MDIVIFQTDLPNLIIIPLLLKIVGIIVCVRKAKSLHRNQFGWGFFGFISPIIAMIWVYNIKSLSPIEIDNIIDYNEVKKD